MYKPYNGKRVKPLVTLRDVQYAMGYFVLNIGEGPALISDFCVMKRLGVVLLPLDGILVHHRLPPSILSGCPQSNLLVSINVIHLGAL